jgi:hypothetical protein
MIFNSEQTYSAKEVGTSLQELWDKGFEQPQFREAYLAVRDEIIRLMELLKQPPAKIAAPPAGQKLPEVGDWYVFNLDPRHILRITAVTGPRVHYICEYCGGIPGGDDSIGVFIRNHTRIPNKPDSVAKPYELTGEVAKIAEKHTMWMTPTLGVFDTEQIYPMSTMSPDDLFGGFRWLVRKVEPKKVWRAFKDKTEAERVLLGRNVPCVRVNTAAEIPYVMRNLRTVACTTEGVVLEELPKRTFYGIEDYGHAFEILRLGTTIEDSTPFGIEETVNA